MENKQTNNNQSPKIRRRDYLSTEKINLGNFSTNKLSNDLKSLEIAERNNSQPHLSRTKQSTQIVSSNKLVLMDETYQEMIALKLANPFRGY